jgi:hypothetical protein
MPASGVIRVNTAKCLYETTMIVSTVCTNDRVISAVAIVRQLSYKCAVESPSYEFG